MIVKTTCCFFTKKSEAPVVTALNACLGADVPNRFQIYMCFYQHRCSMMCDRSRPRQDLEALFRDFWITFMTKLGPLDFMTNHMASLHHFIMNATSRDFLRLTENQFESCVKAVEDRFAQHRRAAWAPPGRSPPEASAIEDVTQLIMHQLQDIPT